MVTSGKLSNSEELANTVRDWPTLPGVYIMRDSEGRILYIGKAKNLRNRVKSYFQTTHQLTPKTQLLVRKISQIECTVTHNELEALLLECNLIKKHRPRYNVRLKDDKNYPYVVMNFTHKFPQFRIMRRVLPSPHLKYFGPYTNSVNEITRFLAKTFQIRDCSDIKFKNRTRPCLNYEIGTCTAPCVGLISEEAYSQQVQEAILFLQGRKKELLKSFKEEMESLSEKQEYERARILRDKIFALRKMTQKQDAVLTENNKDIDVVGCYKLDDFLQWVVLFVRSGHLTGRRTHRMSLGFDDVGEATRTFLEQFYTVSLIPDEIWISSDFEDRETLQKLLREHSKKRVSIRIRRNERGMRLLGMAYENAKLLMHQEQKKKQADPLMELAKVLQLSHSPDTIEGIDVSNLQASKPVVSLVHFEDGKPLKAKYRLYYPKTVEGQNDFAMIYEAVLRRYSNPETELPQLLLIDGGKGQLHAAVKALKAASRELPLCSLAKAKTQSAFSLKRVEKSEERIFLPYRKNPIVLRLGHPALRLLQQVRDEAHRFAITAHRKRRKKAMDESPLTALRGIGEKTRSRLLKKFKSLENIRRASREELLATGLTSTQSESIARYAKSQEE